MTTFDPSCFCRRFLAVLAFCLLSFPSRGAAPAATEKPPTAKVEAKKQASAAVTEEKPAPKEEKKANPAAEEEKPPAKENGDGEVANKMEPPATGEPTAPVDPDDEAAAEKADAEVAAVAKPVSADPVQIYGWREHIFIKDVVEKIQAKLDTGALTSSIHAEEKELFERDGKKWVRFIVTDPSVKKPARTRIEAPLVRMARIKEPGAESVAREVVKLSFTIGERKMRGEFTLNNRSNMLAPVLIGRSLIKDLGWVDASRTYLAEEKVFR